MKMFSAVTGDIFPHIRGNEDRAASEGQKKTCSAGNHEDKYAEGTFTRTNVSSKNSEREDVRAIIGVSE